MAKRRATKNTKKKTAGRKASKASRKTATSKKRARGRKASQASAARRRPVKKAVRRTAQRKKTTQRKRTFAPAATSRPKPAALERERRRLSEGESVPGAPSTLGYKSKASSAESGQARYRNRKREHTEGGPALTAGDIDANWSEAYASGEETPGGDMPSPDQDVVEEIGRALGVEYDDAEELKGSEKIEERDRHRWEYDPASAEDYRDRNKK
jgi:hypothetical protein